MKHRRRRLATPLVLLFWALFAVAFSAAEAPTPAALAAFDRYTAALEAHLTQQHASGRTFLPAAAFNPEAGQLRSGKLLLENATPPANPVGPSADRNATLRDWRGTAYLPGVRAADFEALLHDIPAYPRVFAPQVLHAELLSRAGDPLRILLRVRQHHGLTVVLDTAYNVTFGQLDPQHGWSTSRSFAIVEIAGPGTPHEHPLAPAEAHGFLWRMNTYWTWEERDGGLYLQLESVSLTRPVPTGLGWLVGPYADAIPRESLAFTLGAVRNALQH